MSKEFFGPFLIPVIAVFVFVNVYSFSTLTTKPAIWYDEGINIELARNFSEFGKLDLIVEPLTFSGRGVNIGSTGYPVTVPLAWFFKAFGFGLAQARVYMLLWMNIFLACLFYFLKKTWDTRTALIILLLVASFPSFYANGRSVMGEIPGITFILLTLIWYFREKSDLVAGVFLGLAVISKPSVYLFFVPALILLFFFKKEDFFKKIIRLGLGAFMPLLAWAVIYPEIFSSLSAWQDLGSHFVNPYAAEEFTVIGNIQNNLASFLYSPTLIYFSLFAAVIMLAGFLNRDFYKENRAVFALFGFYSLFQLFFFLKSLGYFRYLIAVQLFIFALLVPSVKVLTERLFFQKIYARFLFAAFFASVVLFQTAYLFTKADLFYSNEIQETFVYIQKNFSESSVGVINLPPMASLVRADKKFQTISTYGLRDLGPHPLSFEREKLPNIIVFDESGFLTEEQKIKLAELYGLKKIIGGITLYEKK